MYTYLKTFFWHRLRFFTPFDYDFLYVFSTATEFFPIGGTRSMGWNPRGEKNCHPSTSSELYNPVYKLVSSLLQTTLLYCISEINSSIASAINFLKLSDFFVGGGEKTPFNGSSGRNGSRHFLCGTQYWSPGGRVVHRGQWPKFLFERKICT